MTQRGARLGQHFLNAQWVARDLIGALNIQCDETVLEIGPGRGALTAKLLESGARVVAIEKDAALVEHLRGMFHDAIAQGQLTLIENDVRSIDPARLGLDTYVVAANIPYYITGEILRQFLGTKLQPRRMALLIQKEVAERVVARDGKESILSLSVKAYGTPTVVAKVPAQSFNPPPSVDSAILLIEDISRAAFETVDEKAFFEVVRAGFSSKRKLLANNLASFGEARAALAACGIEGNARAEDVGLAQWVCLAQRLASVAR
ncbi:MAG TPA: 16S rRNA (adenine(1518)-N(6)/adenine(1519)-N(6))-dimethyltransferase RsmA [Candidatus Paceibacterota bacterium]|nr:16S rRNA (adenine(1518)-N(6)/adenine(1519)-N(6))-dimethyltransferase RsmA [Candidatus Paceibacterota bacterium]